MKDVNDNPRGPSVLEQALEPSYYVTERAECKSDGCSRPAVMESVDEAEGQQGELNRKEQSLKASQKTAVLGWPPRWNGLIPGDSMYLFVLSQILLLCMMLWYSTYGAIPAAQNAFDLLSYLLTPFKQVFSDQGESLTTVGSVVVSYILLSLASLGLLFVGSLFWHLLRAQPDPPFPLQEDRRQSVSRQPSFTYSEWTEDKNEDDFLDLDPVPETPVFDCVMDIKAETDPATLTVKSVGLQERRGSNVSLTLDMCTPGCSEQGFGYVMSPREQSAREYLQTASNILTEEELHKKALDPFILQAEFFKGEEVRNLKHYWYTSWPDQKTPDQAPPLLQLVLEVEEAMQSAEEKNAPVIVHCSAGIGRTGCFIATSVCCKQLKNEGIVDILRTACQLRLDRGGMIQTCEQYQFVHHVMSLYGKQLSRAAEE
ncbi:PREDICTED: tyrosine-protein phosphatase non-receptor type 5 isoform X3 [Corvus brachyrhynchos]|uniref:tyrosine-protein phosphatase non-receptor type 5 isoform X3 n=1 Tax=Corvus brachyrhynchos TaxID=85066 RepID=UPI0008163F7F|nr:PREDICTED: tyrosine-protein phosphatase non-receptor type 5 isoform X3 [Corvus brachyrhynchos]